MINSFVQAVDIGQKFGSPWGNQPNYNLGKLFNLILTGAFTIAGIILIFLFIFGGIQIISSAGSGNSRGAEQGKDAITWAAIGFVIVFATYWIIRVIELISGISFFTNPLQYFGGP